MLTLALLLPLALVPHARPLQPSRVYQRCSASAMQLLPTDDSESAGGNLLASAADAATDGDRWTQGDSGKGFKRGTRKFKGKAKHTERKAAATGNGFNPSPEPLDGLKYTRQPKPGAPCGCGSGNTYAACCSLQHASGMADDVLKLVRARYTAFAYRYGIITKIMPTPRQ